MVKIVIKNYIRKQFFISICLYLGNIVIGYAVGWSSSVVIKLQDPGQTPLNETITDQTASWVGSTVLIGISIGPHLFAPLMSRVGRKICILVGICVNIIGLIVTVFAYNLAMVLGGRTLSGIGLGVVAVLNIVYTGEIASPNIRGIILTGTGVLHTLGTLIAYTVGAYASYAGITYVVLGISVVHFVAILSIPESPMYYLLKGNEEGARNSLKALGRDIDIENEIKTMSENIQKTEQNKSNWKELFTIKSNRKAVIICSILFILQYFNGTVSALYFTQLIFEKANMSFDSSLSTIIVGVTQFLGTLLVPILVEKAGRKTLNLCSFTGCFVGMIALGTYFYLNAWYEQSVANVGWLPLAALIVTVFSFSTGLNIIPNTLTGEMFRPNVRSAGSSLTFTVGTWSGVISVSTFGYLISSISEAYTFWMFAVFNIFGFLFTIFVVKETKGLTLNEIDKMLSE